MPDREMDELRSLARRFHQRTEAAGMPEAVVEDSTDLPANKVRVYRLDIRQSVVVNGLKYRPGLHVWLKMMPDHEWQMLAPAIAASTLVYGEGVGAITIPPGAQETVAWSIPSLGFVPGRLEPSQDAARPFAVHVRAFVFDGGRWDDGETVRAPTLHDLDLTSAVVPATSGYSRWVKVYYDPGDGALHAVNGDAVFTGGNVNSLAFPDSLIDAIPVPSGGYPLGAVAVTYGDTGITSSSRFGEARLFPGKKEIEVDQIVTGHTGAVLVGHSGHVLTGTR